MVKIRFHLNGFFSFFLRDFENNNYQILNFIQNMKIIRYYMESDICFNFYWNFRLFIAMIILGLKFEKGSFWFSKSENLIHTYIQQVWYSNYGEKISKIVSQNLFFSHLNCFGNNYKINNVLVFPKKINDSNYVVNVGHFSCSMIISYQ